MNGVPAIITGASIDEAWSEYLLHVLGKPERRCGSAIVVIDCKNHSDDETDLRRLLDSQLATHGCYSSAITGMTIFPQKLHLSHSEVSVDEFCSLCTERLSPRLKALNQINRNGVYFERMMAFQAVKKGKAVAVNQLKAVIDRLNGPKKFRLTGLQMSCFDPAKDHSAAPQRGFPCLQQIGINYVEDEGIELTALYPSHNVFDRAYGNFLGLIHLGQFIAKHTDMQMVRLHCHAISPRLGKINRGDTTPLVSEASKVIDQGD